MAETFQSPVDIDLLNFHLANLLDGGIPLTIIGKEGDPIVYDQTYLEKEWEKLTDTGFDLSGGQSQRDSRSK